MANEQNLNIIQTESEAREKGRAGGIASGEARRARKTLKEELLLLLAEGDTQSKVSLALIQKAMKGNVKAFEALRDTVGEKPIDKVETSGEQNLDINIKVIDNGA